MGENVQNFFVNVKPVRILVSIKNNRTGNYASAISSDVDATYSHTVRILHKLEDFELVESKKEGRKKIVELTDEGREMAECCAELLSKMP